MTSKKSNFLETTNATAATIFISSNNNDDDVDTSFEIDEPDDEEIIDDVLGLSNGASFGIRPPTSLRTTATTSATSSSTATNKKEPIALSSNINTNNITRKAYFVNMAAAGSAPAAAAAAESSRLYSVPLVSIKDDPGDNSYSSSVETHTDSTSTSTTPTTADVADTAILIDIQKVKRLAPQFNDNASDVATTSNNNNGTNAQNAHLIVLNGGNDGSASSYIDDNISGSIATTTTEIIDVEDMAKDRPINRNKRPPKKVPSAPTVHPRAIKQTANAAQHKRTLSASSSYRSNSSQNPPPVLVIEPRFYIWIRQKCLIFKNSGIGEPSVYHALVVIFLEFFAWGLLTMPVIAVLNQTFPDHTFLMNGLVMGIKGILSFLSAPLIGALSDIWGRKFFLLITVFFTCAPIPLMTINTWWFFAMISISGVFAVTFSVVFAYVADVTTIEERSRAYGLVSATFAASLVISPALGAALMEAYSDTLVVALATAIAVLDVFFILVAVPESLPEKVRPSSWGAPISWEQADPFAALRKVGSDKTILMQCVTVLLSYLPEAGQYSCIFVYLKLKMGFNSMEVAIFIAVVGILSISVQVTLGYLMRVLGPKRTIVVGLALEMVQLLWYGFGNESWMMWAAGVLAGLGSITYPAISAFVSILSTADRQGAVQGMVTGMRGLCNGLGPAMFGVIFYLFNVDLNAGHANLIKPGSSQGDGHVFNQTVSQAKYAQVMPGPPFVFGAFMVFLAICVAIFIPDERGEIIHLSRAPSEKKRVSVDVQYEIENGHKTLGPLIRSDSLAQL